MNDAVATAARAIREGREALKWSAATLAKRARAVARADGNDLQLSQQLVSAFELGKAQKLPHWLKYVREALAAETDHLGQMPAPVITLGENSITLRQVNLAYSMGAGANIDDFVEEGTFDFDASLLRAITRSPPERLYVARGYGDSMFPTLINDDMVVIDTLQTQINLQDRIWACSIHGAGAIKRLRAIEDRRVLVISDNQTVGNQEVGADDLRIVGRVIWIGRRV